MRWFQLLAALALLMVAFPSVGNAQSGSQVWSEPQNISNTSTNSAYPRIAAGPDGVVHVFWTDNLTEYGSFNNVIYYARLDRMGWSQPVDILISPQGLQAMADYPAPLLGKDGRLHVVFVGGWNGQIYYSSANAGNALDARAWSEPMLLSEDLNHAGYPNILEDGQGNLIVIFQCDQGAQQGIYETQSTDGGLSWSQVTLIPGTPLGSDTFLTDTSAAVSPQGVIHVTWDWASLELYPPKGILYIRSPDLGKTWSDVETVIDGPYSLPDIAVSGEKEVVMTWSGTLTDRFKFYSSSNDGGESWTEQVRISTLGGMQGYSAMAVDSEGMLHLAMVASCFGIPYNGDLFEGDALIHSTWDGTSFTAAEPILANTIKENNLQYADIAISEGNIAHMVAMYPIYQSASGTDSKSARPYQFEIFYVQGLLDSAHITPLINTPGSETAANLPVLTGPTSKPTSEITQTMANNHFSTQTDSRTPLPTMTPTLSILIGSFPAIILLALIFGARAWNRPRE